ncbi:MAG: SH3 domain-containing protein [Lachnospiraceae bacterium]|nr:SH3 domain-containing protein [Lachnospiraceae bacterium]
MKKNVSAALLGCGLALSLTAGNGLFSAGVAYADAVEPGKEEVEPALGGISIPLNHYAASRIDPEGELAELLRSGMWFRKAEEVQTEPETVPEQTATEPETEPPTTASAYASVAIARVDAYVNIRDQANTGGNVLGKIYNNCAATILDTVDGEDGKWYYIRSGSVSGYIKANYFVTGEEAEAIARQVGTVIAKTNTGALRLREQPSTSAGVITMLALGEEYVVQEEGIINEEGKEFVKINLDGDTLGYVSRDYVDLRVDFAQAVSVEEERAMLEEQARREQEAEEARRRLEEERQQTTEAPVQTSAPTEAPVQTQAPTAAPTQAPTSAPGSDYEYNPGTGTVREALVAYAKQFLGNPYVWGGVSLTDGADCSGYVLAVYRDIAGISLPHYSGSQANCGVRISADQLQPGDLVFYASGGTINHVAMYIGGGQVIHASSPTHGIMISNMNYRTPCAYVSLLN